MDSGDVEKSRDREKDLLRRSKILAFAEFKLRDEVIHVENLNSFTASKLSVDFAAYQLEGLEQARQAAAYQERLPSEIEKTDREIEELKEILGDCARGHFTKLKSFMRGSIDRVRLVDEIYADHLTQFYLESP